MKNKTDKKRTKSGRKIISKHPGGILVEASEDEEKDIILNKELAIESDKTIQKLNNLENRKYIREFIEKNAYINLENGVINGVNYVNHKMVLRCTMVGGPNSRTWRGILDLCTKNVKMSQNIKLSEFKKDTKFYREKLITDMIDKIIIGNNDGWGCYLEQDFIKESNINYDHLF